MRHATRAIPILIIAAACGGGGDDSGNPSGPNTPTGPTNPNAPGANQVTVVDNAYTPQTITVAAGATVTWNWAGGNYSAHSVTFSDGVGSSGNMTSGSHQRAFSSAGSYDYTCAVHGASMSGTVTVQP